ncbi:hypothetical protein RND81_13G160300 [Saponaria officinalis]|uniref:B3 domain-containing protein n=1 Tax=Saponaria officinalis TaxID=3572 RepID=A0AAW1H5X9_SAPOF
MAMLNFDLNMAPVMHEDGEILQRGNRRIENNFLAIKERVVKLSYEAVLEKYGVNKNTKQKHRKKLIHISQFRYPMKKKSVKGLLSLPPKKRFYERKRRPIIPLPSCDALELIPNYVKTNPEFKEMTDVNLIVQKSLDYCDISKHQDRLSIPCGKILKEFLSESEKNWLKRENPNGKSSKTQLRVKVIGPRTGEVYDMAISRWDYDKNGFRYALIDNWYEFSLENELDLKDLVRIVSFRCNNRLYFAILKLDTDTGVTRV